MEEKNIFEKVLFVGMDYRAPKGGIASVLNTYSTFIRPFKFVRTSDSELNLFSKIWFAVSGYLSIAFKLLTDKNIEIVHIHSASGSSFWRKSIAIRVAKFFKKKVVFHCHGGGFKEFRQKSPLKVDAILNKVDYIICLSNEWKQYFETIGFMNVTVLKNVITSPIIDRPRKDSLVHFLFLGLICENKGIFDILKALATHKEELKGKIVLHIAGNGQTDKLIREVEALQIEELISFEGWVQKEHKSRLLNLADVFILPSYVEGVPISILEAESYHKAVITTRVGGIPSIVKNQESGIFITPGNNEELFQAMKILTESEGLREKYGEVGYQISKDYLPETIKSELIDFYNILLNRTSS